MAMELKPKHIGNWQERSIRPKLPEPKTDCLGQPLSMRNKLDLAVIGAFTTLSLPRIGKPRPQTGEEWKIAITRAADELGRLMDVPVLDVERIGELLHRLTEECTILRMEAARQGVCLVHQTGEDTAWAILDFSFARWGSHFAILRKSGQSDAPGVVRGWTVHIEWREAEELPIAFRLGD
ncbi:Uncharacterised protein [Candidatus Burarchaeum australiense]|nr:Uncharacterised protein [Candidatus Burarchaeum australiense]